MDAPRARASCVSCALLEELKDGKLSVSKHKSKTLHLNHRPHVVVMMNEFPKKDTNEKGSSSNRCTHLIIDKDGQTGKWVQGHRDPHSLESTPHEKIQQTIQSRLPNGLQEALNKAFVSNFSNHEQSASGEAISEALMNAIKSWFKKDKLN